MINEPLGVSRESACAPGFPSPGGSGESSDCSSGRGGKRAPGGTFALGGELVVVSVEVALGLLSLEVLAGDVLVRPRPDSEGETVGGEGDVTAWEEVELVRERSVRRVWSAIVGWCSVATWRCEASWDGW